MRKRRRPCSGWERARSEPEVSSGAVRAAAQSWTVPLLHLHVQTLLQHGVFRPHRLGPGAGAGGRVAHLLRGVVSRVARLLAALAALGTLRVERAEDDLPGGRSQGSGSQTLLIPQNCFPCFVQTGPALHLQRNRHEMR